MGCVLGRPGHEVSTMIDESIRKKPNNVSVTKTETTESTSVVVEEVGNHEATVDQKEENGFVVTEAKDRKSKGERKRSKPDPRRSNPPKNLLGEQVAAGWPSWLSEVCGEALSGWLPRKADSFEMIEMIGSGTYSYVYKVKDSLTGNIVALKKVRFDPNDRDMLKVMAREILILRRLDHPNVIKLEGLVTSRMSSSIYLVFRYMHHDLAGLAANPDIKFTKAQVKCYMKQLLSGLEHCHNRGVLHRDIKGSNLLIDDGGVLKIGDFGLATFFDASKRQQMTNEVVTLWYRAPELLQGVVEYSVGVDLWSAGCILAELFARKPILPGYVELDQLHRIYKLCGSPTEEYWKKIRLPSTHKQSHDKPLPQFKRTLREVYKDFSPETLSLLDTLLAIDPAERQTATDALMSDFFTTEPLACEPSDLPKHPPTKEIDAKRREEEYRRQIEARERKAQGKRIRRMRPRERAQRAMPAPEVNAENRSNIDRMRLITRENAKSKSDKFPPPHQDWSLDFQVGSSMRLDPSEILYSTGPFTYFSKEPSQTWSGPLAPIGASDSTMEEDDINKEKRMTSKVKGKIIVV